MAGSNVDNSFPGLLKFNNQTFEMELDGECSLLLEKTFSIFLEPAWNRVAAGEEGDKNGKYRTKGKAVLKFIYLVEDIRSHLYNDSDEDKINRAFAICKLERWFKLKDIQKHEQINRARERYSEIIRKDPRMRLLASMDKMVDNLIGHIETVDFNAELENGNLKYDPTKYTKLMEEIPSKVSSLHENKKNILSAFASKGRALGDREIGMFED